MKPETDAPQARAENGSTKHVEPVVAKGGEGAKNTAAMELEEGVPADPAASEASDRSSPSTSSSHSSLPDANGRGEDVACAPSLAEEGASSPRRASALAEEPAGSKALVGVASAEAEPACAAPRATEKAERGEIQEMVSPPPPPAENTAGIDALSAAKKKPMLAEGCADWPTVPRAESDSADPTEPFSRVAADPAEVGRGDMERELSVRASSRGAGRGETEPTNGASTREASGAEASACEASGAGAYAREAQAERDAKAAPEARAEALESRSAGLTGFGKEAEFASREALDPTDRAAEASARSESLAETSGVPELRALDGREPGATREAEPASSTEERPSSRTEAKPAPRTEAKPGSRTEENPAPSMEATPGPSAEGKPFEPASESPAALALAFKGSLHKAPSPTSPREESADPRESSGGALRLPEPSKSGSAPPVARQGSHTPRASDSEGERSFLDDETSHAEAQAGESFNLPAFQAGKGKPMLEMLAGSNQWFQATVLRRSRSEMQVLFPATRAVQERREWVSLRSSRIWRGSLSSRAWRYIKGVEGAWEPARKSRETKGRAAVEAEPAEADGRASELELRPSHSAARGGSESGAPAASRSASVRGESSLGRRRWAVEAGEPADTAASPSQPERASKRPDSGRGRREAAGQKEQKEQKERGGLPSAAADPLHAWFRAHFALIGGLGEFRWVLPGGAGPEAGLPERPPSRGPAPRPEGRAGGRVPKRRRGAEEGRKPESPSAARKRAALKPLAVLEEVDLFGRQGGAIGGLASPRLQPGWNAGWARQGGAGDAAAGAPSPAVPSPARAEAAQQ